MYKAYNKLNDYLESISINLNGDEKQVLISFAQKFHHTDLINLLKIVEENFNRFFYFNKPSFDNSFIAVDSLIDIDSNGFNRTAETEKLIEEFKDTFTNNWSQLSFNEFPLFVGGMKFSIDEHKQLWNDFADSDWFIPKIILFESGTDTYLIFNSFYKNSAKEDILSEFDSIYTKLFCQEPAVEQKRFIVANINDGGEKEKNEWVQKVNEALENIEAGEFQKIVLSRRVHVELSQSGSIVCFLNRLKNKFPMCYNFAYRKGDSIFFGATPEKLARIFDGYIEADALAGSISRGNNDVEDAKLAQQLLNSEKNIAEQNTVVQFIVESFNQFADDLDYSEKPIIRKLTNIQHLWTPIRGKLKKNSTIFSVLKTIHPTPAICGAPWSEALTSIKSMESHERGLFAGIVGWFNYEQIGDFAVAIRSAILKKDNLYAYAGCGIVKGSDPIMEYEETQLKLRPILSLFDDEKVYQS